MKSSYVLMGFLLLPCLANAGPSWREKFDADRKTSFGPVEEKSAEDVNRFYLLEGENREAVPQSVEVAPDAPIRVSTPATEKMKAETPRVRKTRKVPMRDLLAKSREAYTNGQLEDARRFYGLVLKADPSSTEAVERLAEIDKQLN